MNMFKAIMVEAKPTKREDGTTSNTIALETASKALKEKGCVALFPQGNFSRVGKEPPRVYSGAAKLAVMNNIAIQVVRLDGYWSMNNPLIPVFVRNAVYYRAFLSAFHMNNIRATLCCVIDFHLKDENKDLSDEQKIDEICAQLYAYYRHTKDLTIEQIEIIKTEITDKQHLLIWGNKVKQDKLEKERLELKKEGTILEESTLLLMEKALIASASC